ncbi:MAG: hypothetical protein H5U08_02860 [Thermogutta sp.]|uniref:RHS repeat-associated core domain-containing protein n=1 Tax=Thermogutta sp. TaxID=1962930 RepID=UPI001998A98E|nr:RHS repeat-associated core domain-containing protein [Thermogutta sp.]MBC7351273.1 hypothetical protein [Thermogutta sp.]
MTKLLGNETVDGGTPDLVQWTLPDHLNTLTAHWTDQLNTVWDITVRHDPGYCQLRHKRLAGWSQDPTTQMWRRQGATIVVNHLIYDAIGRVTSESNPATGDILYPDNWPLLVGNSLFLFTGRPFDSDTELQNNLNRWYDASVGRWLSEDPIGFAGGDGNLYRYVGTLEFCKGIHHASSACPGTRTVLLELYGRQFARGGGILRGTRLTTS